MKELLRTNDVVKLSWLQAYLTNARIESFVLDQYTSILEGSAGAIPRRLMVGDDDYEAALVLLDDLEKSGETW